MQRGFEASQSNKGGRNFNDTHFNDTPPLVVNCSSLLKGGVVQVELTSRPYLRSADRFYVDYHSSTGR